MNVSSIPQWERSGMTLSQKPLMRRYRLLNVQPDKEKRELPTDVIDLDSKAKALVQERDKVEIGRKTK